MLFRSLSCLALAALLAVPLVAQRGGPGPGGVPGLDPMVLHALDLSEAQHAALKAILDAHQTEGRAKQEALHTAEEALETGMLNATTTVDQLKTLHGSVSQAQFDLLLVHRAVLQEALALLSPAQKAKLEKVKKAMGPGGLHRRGGPEGPGMPPPERR